MNEQINHLMSLAHDAEVSWAASVDMEAKEADDKRYERARAVLEAALKEALGVA